MTFSYDLLKNSLSNSVNWVMAASIDVGSPALKRTLPTTVLGSNFIIEIMHFPPRAILHDIIIALILSNSRLISGDFDSILLPSQSIIPTGPTLNGSWMASSSPLLEETQVLAVAWIGVNQREPIAPNSITYNAVQWGSSITHWLGDYCVFKTLSEGLNLHGLSLDKGYSNP